MINFKTLRRCFLFLLIAIQHVAVFADSDVMVPILAYHRFGPVVADSMTVRTTTFETHLRVLREQGYTIIPLQQWVDYLAGTGQQPSPKSVVITVDDGHASVDEYMRPLVERYRIPVTLFIYPSAISNASYALTWDQLSKLEHTGLFNIQSHTYWHPNFKQEKRRMKDEAYTKFVDLQLKRSKQVLEQKTGHQVDLLAWPFGIVDSELMQHAAAAGYTAAFTLDARASSKKDNLLTLPRFLMVDTYDERGFARLLSNATKTR